MSAPSNIYHTASKLTDRRIPAPSVTASRTITQFWVFFFVSVFIGLVQVHALGISSHQLPLLYRSTSGGNSGLTPFSSALVLPWLLGSGRRKVRHREELLSASPWQLREWFRWRSGRIVFFFSLSLSLSLSPCSSLLLLPPSLLSSSPFQRFYSSSLSFSLPLCQLSTFFFFFLPLSSPLISFLCDANQRENYRKGMEAHWSLSLSRTHTHTHSNTHWSGLNTERREHLTESNRLFGRCAHTHMHSTRRHSPLRLSLLSLAGSS